MIYHLADLSAATGIATRTIRHYINLGLLPRPEGLGPAATYGEGHMLRARTVAHLRGEGHSLSAIARTIDGWSDAKHKRFLASAAPKPTPPEAPAGASDAIEGEPVPPQEIPSRPANLEARARPAMPEVPRWSVLPLLPRLALVLADDAPPLARRIAEEIYEKYAGG